MTNKTKITGLFAGALLLCGTQAQAAITYYSWTFNSPTGESSTLGNTVSKTSGTAPVTATAQAWANTNNGVTSGSGASGPKGSNDIANTSSYKLETAYLNVYTGGLGVKNQDFTTDTTYGDLNEGLTSPSPAEHSTDNNQRYDSVLFSFNKAIDLNSVTIGWKDVDSDISLLAYTGTGSCVGTATCTSNLSGKTYAELVNFGWSFIGHYTDLATNVAKAVNAGNVTSSYWLIGALNPLVSATTITKGNDYVKILALAGQTTSVPPDQIPEPGTLLLMGAGLFGLSRFSTRRPGRCAA